MKLISHRGNINGPNPERENTIDFIEEAIQKGFDVEIDIHSRKNELYLGHDKPEQLVTQDWLFRFKEFLWCHAKDIPALRTLLDMKMHTFMHNQDDATLTSEGYIWTYPGKELVPGAIAVLPEIKVWYSIGPWIAGMCSDRVEDYK